MLKENTIIANRYELLRLLGRGGFSEVWLAKDNMTSIQVALKIYAPGTGLDNEGITLFTQEFSLVFDFNHSNLLKPTHYDCFERMPFLVLPYCESGSTSRLIKNVTEKDAWTFLRDVSCGLDFLHSMSPPVIHQDIKPDNVLISGSGRFMITDFGISTRIRSTLRKSIIASTSGGTLAYMAPERFSENPTPIMASDIYSLGVTMYEILTGEMPFGEHGGLLQKNGADIPQINEDYSKVLKDLIYQCLSAEPWARPTARQINKYAQLALEGKPIKIEKNVTPKKLNKKRVGGIVGVAVIICVITLSIIFLSPKDNLDKSIIYDNYTAYIHQGDSLVSVAKQAENESKENFELIYIEALKEYQKALPFEDEISISHVSMNPQQKVMEVRQVLSETYKLFIDKKVPELEELGEYEIAAAFTKRAEALKEVISDNQ